MPVGSRKGFPYEREKSRQLSLWLTKGERDDVLWRTEGSGGRSTVSGKKGKKLPNSYGDIGVKDPNSKEARDFIKQVLLECKRGYTNKVDVLDLLDRKQGIPQIIEWWEKAEKERKQSKRKFTWIILQRNRRKDVIITDNVFNVMIDHIFIKTNELNLGIFILDDWLNSCSPDFFKG